MRGRYLFLGLIVVFAILYFHAVLGKHHSVSSSNSPPPAEVSAWVEGCESNPVSCSGDIYYKNGFPERIDLANGSLDVLRSLKGSGSLGMISRVVKLNGDPTAYAKASQDFYARNGL